MNMLSTITPKSDQLNADDLIGGQTKTITITGVTVSAGDQPVSIHFEGDNGKPWKPCKSMRRVLVEIWGADGKQYVGKSLTLFRDSSVKFGGLDVGGLRVSHMTHLAEKRTLAITATKGRRTPYVVQPLEMKAAPTLDEAIETIRKAGTLDALRNAFESVRVLGWSADALAEIIAAKDERKAQLSEKK